MQCREAVARRDRLIEKLASLPPVHGALDQIVQRFGTDLVAEVTGRARRIIRKRGADGTKRLVGENRAGAANLGKTQAFMDDAKRVDDIKRIDDVKRVEPADAIFLKRISYKF